MMFINKISVETSGTTVQHLHTHIHQVAHLTASVTAKENTQIYHVATQQLFQLEPQETKGQKAKVERRKKNKRKPQKDRARR